MKKQNKLEWIYKIVGAIILLVCLGIVGILAWNAPGFIISLANSFTKLPATLQAGALIGFIVILGWFVNSYFANKKAVLLCS